MTGRKTMRNPENGGVRVREEEHAGAPLRVSLEARIRNFSTPKSNQSFQKSPRSYATLADRPSTSGGSPSPNSIERWSIRDDLHVRTLKANQFGTTYYDFPLPGPLPTPTTTPSASSCRTYSSESLKLEVVGSNYTHSPLGIGMALGSPTHQPVANLTPQALSPKDSGVCLEEWKTSAHSTKPKASKWKKLGGLFGRKPLESLAEFYRVQAEVKTTSESGHVASSKPHIGRTRSRARTNSESKTRKHNPNIQRANTMPMDFLFLGPNEKPKVPPKGPKQFPMLLATQPPEIRLDGGPLLHVEIPSVEMERFSVMFGGVIESTTSASSLLARRQATLDRLKVVSDEIARHGRPEEAKTKFTRPRRVTSPSTSLFPSSLRPPEDGLLHAPRQKSPLHRSNTSPAAMSPNRQTFGPLYPLHEERNTTHARTPKSQYTIPSPWSANDPSLALDSPRSEISMEEIHDSAPLRPLLTEPRWEMVSLHSNTSKNSLKIEPLKLTRKPNMQVHRIPTNQSPQPPLNALAREGANKAEEPIITAPEVSIARQISISRRQKLLLVPVKSRSANRGPVPISKQGYTEGLLVTESKSITPRVVNVEARKAVRSHEVVLEFPKEFT